MSWVADAFGSWYPVVYPHRNEAEAARVIDALEGSVGWRGRRVLDVACGAGRHLSQVRRLGGRPIGIDLSPTLLAEASRARQHEGGDWALVRGDMRALPFGPAAFDVVASFFTSFGYFGETDDRRALAEAARVLRSGGRHVLDYLNRETVLAHPNRVSERAEGAYVVREDRRIADEGRRAVKRIEIRAAGGETLARYEERVTLYSPDEVRAFLRDVGLDPLSEWGDYDGSPFDPSHSARHVLVSGKERA